MAAPWCGPICTKEGATRRCVRSGSGCDNACLVPGKGQASGAQPTSHDRCYQQGGVPNATKRGVFNYSLSKRGQKGSKSVRNGSKSVRNGGFSTRNSGGCLCVYGGSHSPTRRPPILIDRAARRDLAALAPLATGPHGLINLGAVLARCLRGRHRYAGGSGLRRACADSLAASGSNTRQARRCASRQPVRPARQPPRWPDSSSQARARQASGPPPAVALRAA